MRNRDNSLTGKIIEEIESLPYFTIDNLKIIEAPPYQIRIALSRLEKRGIIIRLKKGFYTSKKFIEKTKTNGMYTSFMEFTEIPVSFTLVTRNKTFTISNKLARFIYHKIKDGLFCGYRVEKRNGYLYYKADKVKALFDFLYLRKNMILNQEIAEELRLNLEVFKRSEIKRLKEYVDQEGSRKMKEIFHFLF